MNSELHHLLIIEDEEGGFQKYLLNAPIHTIGRDPKCNIRLFSKFTSRRQATLVQIPNEDGSFYYRLVDGIPKGKHSSNGMLVNGRRILACDLHDQDEILFGPQVRMIYHLTEIAEDDLGNHEASLVSTYCWAENISQTLKI